MKKTFITTSLIAALMAMPAFADPTAQELLDQKNVTSKYYVDQELATKQDTISIDKVLFQQGDGGKIPDIYVPAIVATNATGTTLNGNTVGVLDLGSMTESGYGMDMYWDSSNYNVAAMDSFVPTVRAVADALSNIKSSIALKQDRLSGAAGSVVTYTGTAGQVSSTAVSSGATYNGATLTNGDHIANIAAVETAVAAVETAKQDKMTCAGYVPGHENDINYCWLYGDIEVATCKAYGESATAASQCCSGYLQSGMNLCGCDDVSDCPSGHGYNNCDASHVCKLKNKV